MKTWQVRLRSSIENIDANSWELLTGGVLAFYTVDLELIIAFSPSEWMAFGLRLP